MLSSRIRVIFKQSPSPQHLAVLFISTHTLHTRLQALICCQYQGRHSVLNKLPPDSLCLSLSISPITAPSVSCDLCLCHWLFFILSSIKPQILGAVLKITRRAPSALNEITFEVDISQNHIPVAVTTQRIFVQSIFLTTWLYAELEVGKYYFIIYTSDIHAYI